MPATTTCPAPRGRLATVGSRAGTPALTSLVLLVLTWGLGACSVLGSATGGTDEGADTDPPANQLCRILTPEDVAKPDNDTEPVSCARTHTAETFSVARLPARFDSVAYDAASIGTYAYQVCSPAFEKHLGADESLVMRAMVSWAFFRPSKEAWDAGARWIRCDLLGGAESSTEYLALPERTSDLLADRPDQWLVCARGSSVTGPKVPCSEVHSWRAVTSIKLGAPGDDFPGDAKVASMTKDYCSKSVGAWLGYPDDYEYGYTYFHEAEWAAGNRRSVCWARTDH